MPQVCPLPQLCPATMPSVWPQTMPQLCIALDQVPIPEWNVEVIVISKLRDGKSKRAKVVYTSYLAIFISSTSSVCCGDGCPTYKPRHFTTRHLTSGHLTYDN